MQITRNFCYFASITLFLTLNVSFMWGIDQLKVAPQDCSSFESNLANPIYIETILPYDLSYVQHLLGRAIDQDCAYIQSVIRLFANLFKCTPCMNAYSFGILVRQLPTLLKSHVGLKKTESLLQKAYLIELDMYNRFQVAVNQMLFSSLSTRFHEFKEDPETFLNSMSCTIMEIAQEEMAREQLRASLIRFLEIGLSKLMWDVSDFCATWDHVLMLSNDLAQLLRLHILDDPADLDDLYWSLIQRYTLFLKLNAIHIPQDFYQRIEKDLDLQEIPLLSLEEQEVFIETKKSFFTRVVVDCKAKGIAFNYGILTK